MVRRYRRAHAAPLAGALDKRATTADNEAMMVCKQVRYTGRVQGVGFRYTAQRLATDFAVTGYVRNLPDGDVELVAEGAADQVDGFLAVVARAMAGYIDECSVEDVTPGGYKGFRIRF
jgi:acylphosphatase